MMLSRWSRSGPSEGCGTGAFTLSGMTLATRNVAVPPASESAVPSGPRRQRGGISTVMSPGVQATIAYRTIHCPGVDAASTVASVSGSVAEPDGNFPARMRQPAGAVIVRSMRIVSPTVG